MFGRTLSYQLNEQACRKQPRSRTLISRVGAGCLTIRRATYGRRLSAVSRLGLGRRSSLDTYFLVLVGGPSQAES